MSEASFPADAEAAFDPREYAVLIVDNDRAHARAMSESLERVGYRCTVATSGRKVPQRSNKARLTW